MSTKAGSAAKQAMHGFHGTAQRRVPEAAFKR